METTTSFNASSIPSAKDLLLAVPRLAQRAGSFAFYQIPDAFDGLAGKIFNGGSIIADATARHAANSTITNMSTQAQSTAHSGVRTIVDQAWTQGTASLTITSPSIMDNLMEGLVRIKNFGGIFSYLTSKWALATFTAAIVLNRTQFYASSRQHLRLRWHMRLALYLIPVTAFLVQMLYILQAMRCQTSADYPLLRYGDPDKRLSIDFGGEAGFLYRLSSSLLFWQTDADACTARRMSFSSVTNNRELRGSTSLLFSFFITLCISQLFETLASALQGKQPLPETGMTIFEHSLAFAECEAMISNALGLDVLTGSNNIREPQPNVIRISQGELMQRLNVPPEVLLVCLISCFSHLSSAFLAVIGKRHKVRLINTAIWSSCYMAAFLSSFARLALSRDDGPIDLGILRFPTVCIVGFVPHLLIILGIIVCALVYTIAFLVTAFSVPTEVTGPLTLRQRFSWAFQNLQANVHFSSASSIRIKMSEDFYTTLLKIGFNLLTAASEAVYLNEGSRIQVAKMTWLEQKRIDQRAASIEARSAPKIPAELLGDGIAHGLEFTDHQNIAISQSPYARERKSRPKKGDRERARGGDLDSGLGMTQRRSRMHLTFEFLVGIFWLLAGLQAQLMIGLLSKLGIERRPNWLVKFVSEGAVTTRSKHGRINDSQDTNNFGMLDGDGMPWAPEDENVDIEAETRRRLQAQGDWNEESLSAGLYTWWSNGGWFGILDDSGDYLADSDQDNDDLTSVISEITDADDELDGVNDPNRTPTQHNAYSFASREASPSIDDARLDVGLLSRLLDPQNAADREEARLLSHTLRSERPLTRGQYQRQMNSSRNQLIKGLHEASSKSISEDEEEQDLEQFILAQRSKPHASTSGGASWETGAEGMGASGPQCVVCQSSPRSILVWPCGCLSMCDECRVGLAARNYTKCICCRTDIAAYSRLYVP